MGDLAEAMRGGVTRERTGVVAAVWQVAWLPAIVVILLLLVRTPLQPLAFAAAPLYFGLRWLARKSPFPKTRGNPFLLVFLASFALAFGVMPKYPEGIELAAHLVAGILIMFVLYDRVRTGAGLWQTAALAVVIGTVLAVITPFSVPWRGLPMIPLPVIYELDFPILFETTNVNVMASMLAPTLLLAVTCLRAPDARIRLVGAVAIPPIAMMLFLLQARGAWLAAAAGLIVWLALYNRWLVPALPLLLLGALVLNNALGGVSPAQFLYGPVGAELNETVAERQELWEQAAQMIAASPVTGIGVGGYEYVAPYLPPFSAENPMGNVPNAHNLWLQIGLDSGIVGVVGFVAFWAALGVTVFRAYRAGRMRDLAIGVLAALTVLVVHEMGESNYWGYKAGFIMWYILGMALLFDKRDIEL